MSFWDWPGEGFFIYWGVLNWMRARPNDTLTVYRNGVAIAGFVPYERTGATYKDEV